MRAMKAHEILAVVLGAVAAALVEFVILRKMGVR